MAKFAKRTDVFTDIKMDLDLNPVTKDLQIVSDEVAVSQSLKKLLTVKKLWNFDNMNLNQLLFEDFSAILQNTVILSEIEKKLLYYEPRLSYVKIDSYALISQGLVELDIVYSVKTFVNQTFTTKVFKKISNY